MQQSYDQAAWHCKLLTGQKDPELAFQIYYDPRGSLKRPDLAQSFTAKLSSSWQRILNAQQQHCGIFITVNKTDGAGRKKENITEFRAAFIDWDGMQKPQFVVPPTFVTQRDQYHGHAYWLFKPGEVTTPGQFVDIQKRLQLYYGTDPQVLDESRVLRLAGTVHYKDVPQTSMYQVAEVSETKYTLELLRQAHLLPPAKDAELEKFISARIAIETGEGYNNSEHYNKLFIKWASVQAPIGIEHVNGSLNVYRAAGWAHDHGIPIEDAKQILWDHYNPRCQPPWAEQERDHFEEIIERTYLYAKNAPGCLTAGSLFKTLGKLPEPVKGWTENATVNQEPSIKVIPSVDAGPDDTPLTDGTRINRKDAEILIGNLTVSSGHYDLAQAFDGIAYNGWKLLRCDKQFYISNGRSWKPIEDDAIKAQIHRFYADFRPPDSFTRGIFNVLCDMVNRSGLQNGIWLNDPDRDGSNTVVFNNGMVTFSGSGPFKLVPHDRNFFTFNECNYPYVDWREKPIDTPHWDEFLRTVFGDNYAPIDLIHEWGGYNLTNALDLQKFMILIGPSRSGKGTITRVMTNVIGKNNAVSPTLQNITKDTMLEKMSTKKMALIPDAHSVTRNLRESTLSMLKAIIGNDAVTFDVKYKSARTVLFPTRITISTNSMPEFVDNSGALAARMEVIVMDKSFIGIEDIELDEKLKKEVIGISQKFVQGLERLRGVNKNRFTKPEESKREIEEMREDMSPITRFVKTCCDLREDMETTTDELFAMYEIWCKREGAHFSLTKTKFSKALKYSGLPVKPCRPYGDNGKRHSGFRGITISKEFTNIIQRRTIPPFPVVPDHK